jgi:hypothetical protein
MGSVVLNGATSGATTITPTDAVTATLTLPSTTGTLGLASGSATQSINAQNTFGFKNRIINGGMVIDQRNAGASVTITDTANVTYTLDRYAAYGTVASKFSVQQNAGSITAPVGFSNYLGVTSLATTTVGSTDRYQFRQSIEGFNTADFAWGTANAKTVTLSFQVYSSLTGTFGGSIQNSAFNRSYPFSYSIPTANTWTTVSVTIVGDTSGTWIGATNGAGLYLVFGLGVGSSLSGTAGSWASADYRSATGAVSVVGTSGATFYITGVQLEVGTQATSFDFRDYTRELQLCQRYYYLWAPTANSLVYGQVMHNITSSGAYGSFTLPVIMRSPPTLTTQGTSTNYGAYQGGTQLACNGVPIIDISHTLTPSLNFPFGGTLTVAGTCFPRAINSLGYLGFNAEL